MARSRTGQTSATPASGPTIDPARCVWTTRGARCLMRGTLLYGPEGKETRYCTWHDEARRNPRVAEDADEFAKWCLTLRKRGYCGDRFEWSHATPAWLFQLVSGDESAALEPPRRCGCAKSSCPYGWNGDAPVDAGPARAVTPARADGPLATPVPMAADPAREPVPVGEALPAWVTEAAGAESAHA